MLVHKVVHDFGPAIERDALDDRHKAQEKVVESSLTEVEVGHRLDRISFEGQPDI